MVQPQMVVMLQQLRNAVVMISVNSTFLIIIRYIMNIELILSLQLKPVVTFMRIVLIWMVIVLIQIQEVSLL